MPSEVWKVRLLGGFRVESPSGDEVLIPSRKARALLALLALNDGIAIPRESLGERLWPDKPRVNQQQSLRQSIKEVREAFAPHEALDATRDVCRLALDYSCDALECLNSGKDAGNVALLPEMPEPAFESYRTELASYAPLGEVGEAARGAATLLEWTLIHDPSRALAMLHTCRELMPSMPLPLLESALRTGLEAVASDHPLQPWGRVQFAIVLMWAGRMEEGIRVAKEALAVTEPVKDAADWTAAAHTAAIFLIFRGRFEKAQKLIENAIEIAESHGLTEAANRFRHADSLRHLYCGDWRQALDILTSLPSTPIIEAHRAICLVLSGQPEEARVALDAARALAGADFDARLASQLRMAEGNIHFATGNRAKAMEIYGEMVAYSDSYGIKLVQIHALEGLAILHEDPAAKSEFLERAMVLRELHRFPLLPLDRTRLAAVLSSSRGIA